MGARIVTNPALVSSNTGCTMITCGQQQMQLSSAWRASGSCATPKDSHWPGESTSHAYNSTPVSSNSKTATIRKMREVVTLP